MNILITGIHGFVGNNLVNALKTNHSIFGLDIVSPQKDGVLKTYNWTELDDLPSVDCIIHLAGKAHDTKNQTEAQTYFEINTELTKKMYDWYLQSSAKQFILFSSVKAAADQVVGDFLTEEVIPTPKGPYGESKIAAESYILSNMPDIPNKKVYIFRPCMIHGPGNKGNLNLLYKIVSKGIPYPLGAFNNQRSFCSIDNLIYVINKTLELNIKSGVYNICDDQPISTNDLINIIVQTLNTKNKTLYINKNIIKFVADIGSFLHLPLNKERLTKLTENYIVSNAKIKNAIGIDYLPVNTAEGLARTIKSFDKL